METIYDGNYDYALLRKVAELTEGIDLKRKTRSVVGRLDDVAREIKRDRRAVRKLAAAAQRARSFHLRLEGGGVSIPVAEVVTTEGFDGACKKAIRTYRGTLGAFETQGFYLTDGASRYEITNS